MSSQGCLVLWWTSWMCFSGLWGSDFHTILEIIWFYGCWVSRSYTQHQAYILDVKSTSIVPIPLYLKAIFWLKTITCRSKLLLSNLRDKSHNSQVNVHSSQSYRNRDYEILLLLLFAVSLSDCHSIETIKRNWSEASSLKLL